MGWEDRPYYRDRSDSPGGPLMWLLTGSVPLFTAFGVRVRAHASLLILVVLLLLLGVGEGGGGVSNRVQAATILFGIILLHEFGHVFAARYTGGTADEILLTPLGGMAFAGTRNKPWPAFFTAAGGPAVNVVICLITGGLIYALSGDVLWHPWTFGDGFPADRWLGVYNYAYWVYVISYLLLLFNLLPVWPLDGGRMLQGLLWRPMGYYKSMLSAMNLGLGGSVLMAIVGLALLGVGGGGILLIAIAIMCFLNCLQTRRMLVTEGPWAFSDEDEADYAASLWEGSSPWTDTPTAHRRQAKKRKMSPLTNWRQRLRQRRSERQARADAEERDQVDRILAKVSAGGMGSLTRTERRTLEKATEHSRQRGL